MILVDALSRIETRDGPDDGGEMAVYRFVAMLTLICIYPLPFTCCKCMPS